MEFKKDYDPSFREEISITIDTEEGNKECFIVATPRSKYGEYIALLPKEKDLGYNKILLYKVVYEDTTPSFVGIEDDAEYDYANELLSEIIDDHGFNDLIKKYKDTFNN